MLRGIEQKDSGQNRMRRRRRRRRFCFPILDMFTIASWILLFTSFDMAIAFMPYPKASLRQKLEEYQPDSILIAQPSNANILTKIFDLKKDDAEIFKTQKNNSLEKWYNNFNTNEKRQRPWPGIFSTSKPNKLNSSSHASSMENNKSIASKNLTLRKYYSSNYSNQKNINENMQIKLNDYTTSNLLPGINFRPPIDSGQRFGATRSFIRQAQNQSNNEEDEDDDDDLILDNEDDRKQIPFNNNNNNIDNLDNEVPTGVDQIAPNDNTFEDFYPMEFPVEAGNFEDRSEAIVNNNNINSIPTNPEMFMGNNMNSYPDNPTASSNFECFGDDCGVPSGFNKPGYGSPQNLYPPSNNHYLSNNNINGGFGGAVNMPFPMGFPNEGGSGYGSGMNGNMNYGTGVNQENLENNNGMINEMGGMPINNMGYGNINNNFMPYGNNGGNGNEPNNMAINSGFGGNVATNEDTNYVINALNSVNGFGPITTNNNNNNGLGAFGGNPNYANNNYQANNIPNGNFISSNSNGNFAGNNVLNGNFVPDNVNSGIVYPNNNLNSGFGSGGTGGNEMVMMPDYPSSYGNNNGGNNNNYNNMGGNMFGNGEAHLVSPPGTGGGMLAENGVGGAIGPRFGGNFGDSESEYISFNGENNAINGGEYGNFRGGTNNNNGMDFDLQKMRRYNEYLELINRKYGIVIPGGHPTPVNNLSSLALNNNNVKTFIGNSVGNGGDNMGNNNGDYNSAKTTGSGSTTGNVPISSGFIMGNGGGRDSEDTPSKTGSIRAEKTDPATASNPRGYGKFPQGSPEQNPLPFFAISGANNEGNNSASFYSSGNSENGSEKPTTTQMPNYQSTSSIQALTQQIRRLPAVFYVDSRDDKVRKTETMLRETYGLPLVSFYVDKIDNPTLVEKNLQQLTAHKTMPYLFICGTFIGSQEHIDNYHNGHQIPQLVEYVCGEKKNNKKKSAKKRLKKKKKKPRRISLAGVPFKGS